MGKKKMHTMGNTEKYLKARNLYENKTDDGAEIKAHDCAQLIYEVF